MHPNNDNTRVTIEAMASKIESDRTQSLELHAPSLTAIVEVQQLVRFCICIETFLWIVWARLHAWCEGLLMDAGDEIYSVDHVIYYNVGVGI